jgi:NAD-dependent deacetylase
MESTRIFPDRLLQLFKQAGHVVVLTGAGISAESGVPTFRDAQTGLWERFSPEELASPEAFRRDPRLVWEWYAWRRELVSRASPNAGHLALVELEQRLPAFTLITQNVDGLHQRAGSGVRFPVIELHGNIQRTKCFEENQIVAAWEETGEIPPRCPRCAGLLRPDVVWFGELLPADALSAAFDAATGCDLFLSVGTSGLVEPAASLPFRALAANIPVVEINPHPTPLSDLATFVLPGPAGELLPALVKAVWGAFQRLPPPQFM